MQKYSLSILSPPLPQPLTYFLLTRQDNWGNASRKSSVWILLVARTQPPPALNSLLLVSARIFVTPGYFSSLGRFAFDCDATRPSWEAIRRGGWFYHRRIILTLHFIIPLGDAKVGDGEGLRWEVGSPDDRYSLVIILLNIFRNLTQRGFIRGKKRTKREFHVTKKKKKGHQIGLEPEA